MYQTLVRAKGNDSLSLEEMQQRLPSIFASQPHASRSDRYIYIDTRDVIGALVAENFRPVEARVSWPRDEERRGFAKHLVRFRKAGGEGPRRVGDSCFEIILRNAHDGTASYSLMAGLFRFVCLNGLVVAAGDMTQSRVRHAGDRNRQLAEVVNAAYDVLEMAPRVLEAPARWSQIELQRDEQLALARSAHRLRFANAEGDISTAIAPEQLLHTRRPSDSGKDLWTIFNVVQENVIRGGISAASRDHNGRWRQSTTREVRGIDQNIKLNKALWQLGEGVAAVH
jgi:hypothetical protein